MEFTLKTTEKDYKSIVYFSTFGKKKEFFAVYTILVTLYTLLSLNDFAKGDFDLFTAICCGLLIIAPLLNFFSVQYTMKKYLCSEDTAIGTVKKLIINPDEIIIYNLTTNESENLSWEKIHILYETKKYFYLYAEANTNLSIAKTNISEQQIIELRAMAAKKLDKKFKKKFK